jgi:glycosyltransferase involved in cell wall biosynthesis
MRLCFIDFADWNYNVDGPALKPLGGSQSALCYLSVELAKIGHDVTVMTGTGHPGKVSGVECINISNANGWFFRNHEFDVVIVLNAGGRSALRSVLPPSTKLLLWAHLETAQPSAQRLAWPEVSNRWDNIVCVSDYQRKTYLDAFKLAPERLAVIRNAIAPSFERLFRSSSDLHRAKSGPLTLAYTSTPYRGLHLLAGIFPEIRRSHPEAKLNVYSSMAVYQQLDTVEHKRVYDALKATDGVEYVGALPQPDLAQRLATSHVLAYPNTFPEMHSIAVMEALAAGLRVVTSDYAGLPEGTDGFADLVHLDHGDMQGYVREYTRALGLTCSTDGDAGDLYDQVAYMNRHHTWSVRARQWSEFLQDQMKGTQSHDRDAA